MVHKAVNSVCYRHLILSVAHQDLAGAARLLCNFHACRPAGPNWIDPGPALALSWDGGMNHHEQAQHKCSK